MEQPNNPTETKAEVISQVAPDLLAMIAQGATVQHIYFNGIVIAQGTGDITAVLQLNGRPIATLNCSFTIAKTVAKMMNEAITNLETLSGRPMLTTEEVARLITEKKDAESKSV